jgi:putative flippase GtrA
MDVDLSTDLAALLPLVAPLLSEHSDVAIGTRLQRGARVARGPRREMISRGYNLLLRAALRARFSDAQCGFKAMRVECARALLPHVHDTGWFFDTELLVLAERTGLRIAEIPVDWVDDPDSRVDIIATARDDVRGILRVAGALLRGRIPVAELRQSIGRGAITPVRGVPPRLTAQALRFGAIGALSTLAYLLLYLLLRPAVGAQGANACALLITALANTAANRRVTFGVRGAGAARHHLQGLLVFALSIGLTSGSLTVLHAVSPMPSRPVELSVLVTANLLATAARFVLLREWVFARRKEWK